MKRIAIILFCLLCLSALPAIYAVAAPTRAEWQQLKSDKAFSYKNEVESMPVPDTKQESALQKIILSIIHFFAGPAGTLLLWVLVIGIVSYIVYWLAVSNGSFFFGGSAKKMGDTQPTAPNEDDIAATNWEAMLQQARHNNDTRLEVRYRYMWLLQMLQEHELIRYRSDKTNYDYYTELNETEFRQPFRQMSRLYEYTWYGNFALSASLYQDYSALFNNMKNQLSR